MACNDKDTNCSPCKDCPPMPDPVLPRCDIALPDGTFTNATVVVEDGCIISVHTGRAPQYTPEICCAEPTGGGGGNDEPCDCPPGENGENATIDIGDVRSVAPTAPARVINVGTPTNAVLEFELPRGAAGSDAGSPTGASSSLGGLIIQNGVITGLPVTWPPVQYIQALPSQPNVTFDATAPDPTTGMVSFTLNLSQYTNDERYERNQAILAATQPLQDQISALTSRVATLESQINTINSTLATCCP